MRSSLAFASAASLAVARLATATPTVAANDTSLAERGIPLLGGLTAALTGGVCLDVGFGVGLVTAPVTAGVELDVCLCVNLDAVLTLGKRGQQTPRVRINRLLRSLTRQACPACPAGQTTKCIGGSLLSPSAKCGCTPCMTCGQTCQPTCPPGTIAVRRHCHYSR